MSQIDEKIAKGIQAIAAAKPKKKFPMMSGVVVSSDEVTMEATVRFSNQQEASQTEGILLNVTLANSSGVYCIPADNCDCEVAELDGGGIWTMIRASRYKKVFVSADTLIQFNDGLLGGMVKLGGAIAKFNAIESDLQQLKAAFTTLLTALSAVAVSAPTSPVLNAALSSFFETAFTTYKSASIDITVPTDLENTKIKQ